MIVMEARLAEVVSLCWLGLRLLLVYIVFCIVLFKFVFPKDESLD